MLSITGLTPGGREMRQRWAGGLHHTNPPRYWRTATVPVLRVTARDVFITLALCNKYRVLALLTAATRPAYRRYTATLNTHCSPLTGAETVNTGTAWKKLFGK